MFVGFRDSSESKSGRRRRESLSQVRGLAGSKQAPGRVLEGRGHVSLTTWGTTAEEGAFTDPSFRPPLWTNPLQTPKLEDQTNLLPYAQGPVLARPRQPALVNK